MSIFMLMCVCMHCSYVEYCVYIYIHLHTSIYNIYSSMFFWLRDSGPLYLSLSFVWRQISRSVANVQIQRLKVCLAIGLPQDCGHPHKAREGRQLRDANIAKEIEDTAKEVINRSKLEEGILMTELSTSKGGTRSPTSGGRCRSRSPARGRQNGRDTSSHSASSSHPEDSRYSAQ